MSNRNIENQTVQTVQEEIEIDVTAPTPVIEYNSPTGYNQWAVHPGGKFSPTMPTEKKILPGFYEVGQDNQIGFYLQRKKITIDELYHLPSDELQDMIEDIEKFWDRK